MTLLDAFEDFTTRTLNAFTSSLQKLQFVVSLRIKDGKYAHWGMKRTYGRDRANQAIARAHQELTLEILETPIPQLHETAARSEFRLKGNAEELGPEDWDGGAKEHLDYVLNSLTLLDQRSEKASHPAA